MDSAAPGFRALVLLALQASVFGTVFGFGLDTTLQDMLWVLRRPRLLMRSIVAMFVIMPAVAIALATLFDFLHVVEVALVALSISPVPPLLPRRQGQSGARGPYALGLMAWLALLSIGLVPGAFEVVERFAKQPLEMDPLAVARTVVGTALGTTGGWDDYPVAGARGGGALRSHRQPRRPGCLGAGNSCAPHGQSAGDVGAPRQRHARRDDDVHRDRSWPWATCWEGRSLIIRSCSRCRTPVGIPRSPFRSRRRISPTNSSAPRCCSTSL